MRDRQQSEVEEMETAQDLRADDVTPAASPVAGVSAEMDYHFTDEQVMGALVGTAHLSGNLRRNLSHMTSGEKFSLYRAIVNLAKEDRNG